MVFGNGTEDLDAGNRKNNITNSSYILVQNRAKQISPNIILALGALSASEQAKFKPYGQGGLINVAPLPDTSHPDYEYTKNARLIAVAHETQHALDHLDTESPMAGFAGSLTGEKGVRSELHAFASQAATTDKLLQKGEKVERKLIDMKDAVIQSEPDAPTELLLNIMKYYAWYYSNNFKKANPEYEKVKGSPTLIDTTKRYIAQYLPEAKALYNSLFDEKEELRIIINRMKIDLDADKSIEQGKPVPDKLDLNMREDYAELKRVWKTLSPGKKEEMRPATINVIDKYYTKVQRRRPSESAMWSEFEA